MHGSRQGTGYKPGQARYANAVYTYQPNFSNGDYREGVVAENDRQVVFEFYTPYIIAATPANDKPWGIYEPGCRNGLVLHGKATGRVSVSIDQGHTWQDGGAFVDGLDLTEQVKGYRQWFLRFEAPAGALAGSGLTIRTVCQASVGVLPRLPDGESTVTFAASGRALVCAGPTKSQAASHIVAGAFDSPSVTLQLASPRGEPALGIYASAQVASGNPPRPNVKQQVDYSLDGGRTWKSIVKEWTFPRLGEEPGDFWSQSFCYGSSDLPKGAAGSVQIRFRNNAGQKYLRAEATLSYATASQDATRVAFEWTDPTGRHSATHLFAANDLSPWRLATGQNVQTRSVELSVVPRGEQK
jgi:hypothetical protein